MKKTYFDSVKCYFVFVVYRMPTLELKDVRDIKKDSGEFPIAIVNLLVSHPCQWQPHAATVSNLQDLIMKFIFIIIEHCSILVYTIRA